MNAQVVAKLGISKALLVEATKWATEAYARIEPDDRLQIALGALTRRIGGVDVEDWGKIRRDVAILTKPHYSPLRAKVAEIVYCAMAAADEIGCGSNMEFLRCIENAAMVHASVYDTM